MYRPQSNMIDKLCPENSIFDKCSDFRCSDFELATEKSWWRFVSISSNWPGGGLKNINTKHHPTHPGGHNEIDRWWLAETRPRDSWRLRPSSAIFAVLAWINNGVWKIASGNHLSFRIWRKFSWVTEGRLLLSLSFCNGSLHRFRKKLILVILPASLLVKHCAHRSPVDSSHKRASRPGFDVFLDVGLNTEKH